MRSLYFLILTIITLPVCAQKNIKDTAAITGIWKGTSLCTIKSSPCHDEQVVYYITAEAKAGNYRIVMNKIVNGVEEDMAVIAATYNEKNKTLTGMMKNYPAWILTITGKEINGKLLLSTGTLYRIIHMVKD